MTTPAHRRPHLLLLVGLGGAIGTALRHLLTTTVGQHAGGFPTATLVENLLGSLLLGALLESLLRLGPEGRGSRLVRLGLGTGILGGFTTFSSLALEVVELLAGGQHLLALGYAAASVGLGLLACLLGVWAAGAVHRRRRPASTRPGGADR